MPGDGSGSNASLLGRNCTAATVIRSPRFASAPVAEATGPQPLSVRIDRSLGCPAPNSSSNRLRLMTTATVRASIL